MNRFEMRLCLTLVSVSAERRLREHSDRVPARRRRYVGLLRVEPETV